MTADGTVPGLRRAKRIAKLFVFVSLTLAALGALSPKLTITSETRQVLGLDSELVRDFDALVSRHGQANYVAIGVLRRDPSGCIGQRPPDGTLLITRALGVAMKNVSGTLPELMLSPNATQPSMASLLAGTEDVLLEHAFSKGLLVADNGCGAALHVALDPLFDPFVVLDQIKRALKQFKHIDDHVIVLAGDVVAENELAHLIVRDLLILVPVAAIVMLSVLSLLLGNFLMAATVTGLSAFSFGMVVTLVLLLGIPISPPMTMLPVLLITVGTLDELHIALSLARSRTRDGAEILGVAVGLRRPILLCFATNLVAFLILSLIDIRAISLLGIVAAIGVCLNVAVTFFLSPFVFFIADKHFGRAFWNISGRAKKVFSPRIIKFVPFFLLGLCALPFLEIEDSWQRNFPTDSSILQQHSFYQTYFAGPEYLVLTVKSDDPQYWHSIENYHRLSHLTEVLVALPNVDRVLAHPGYFAAVRDNARVGDGELNVASAASAFGNRRVYLLAEELLSHDGSTARMKIFLESTTYSDVMGTIDQIASITRGVELDHDLFGKPYMTVLMVQRTVGAQLAAVPIVALAIFIIVFAVFRDAFTALIVTATPLIAATIIFGAMSMISVPVGFASSLAILTTLGVGVNFAIYWACAKDGSAEERVQANRVIWLSALVVATGMLALAGSSAPTTRILGLSIAGATLICGYLASASFVLKRSKVARQATSERNSVNFERHDKS
ncbi:MMPL family transporter [Roseibium album]|uniref:MMPL family transporter n=1 Tax=Roseibium album TaxID=311410 RepID=UPI003BB13E06